MATSRGGRGRRLDVEGRLASLIPPSLAVAAFVVAVGTSGYMVLEGWSLRESLYMTVITLSTVGFGEVRPLSEGGQIFTVGLILGGVAALGFALVAVGERVADAPRRRLERRVRRMNDHVIVCGYGRIARTVIPGLLRQGYRVNVIEQAAEPAEAARRAGVPVLRGDATVEENLEQAGVRRAAVVAALLPHDGDNLSITMTATALRPGIRVVARSEEERSVGNLRRAGAHPEDVVSPHRTAGQVVLRILTQDGGTPLTPDLREVADGHFETGTLTLDEDSRWIGKSVAEASIGAGANVLVVAVTDPSGSTRVAPPGDQRLQAGDRLTLMGRAEDLETLGARRGNAEAKPGD